MSLFDQIGDAIKSIPPEAWSSLGNGLISSPQIGIGLANGLGGMASVLNQQRKQDSLANLFQAQFSKWNPEQQSIAKALIASGNQDAVMGLITRDAFPTPEEQRRQKAIDMYNEKYGPGGTPHDPPKPVSEISSTPGAGDYRSRTVGIESGGDPTIKNSRSSARGLYQHTDATRIALSKRLGIDPNDMSVEAQNARQGALEQEQRQTLTAVGLPVTDANMYTLHFFGGPVGTKVLKTLQADPNVPIESVVPNSFLVANPDVLPGRTVGQVYGGIAQQYAGGAPTNIATPAMAAPQAQPPQSFSGSGMSMPGAETPGYQAVPSSAPQEMPQQAPVQAPQTQKSPADLVAQQVSQIDAQIEDYNNQLSTLNDQFDLLSQAGDPRAARIKSDYDRLNTHINRLEDYKAKLVEKSADAQANNKPNYSIGINPDTGKPGFFYTDPVSLHATWVKDAVPVPPKEAAKPAIQLPVALYNAASDLATASQRMNNVVKTYKSDYAGMLYGTADARNSLAEMGYAGKDQTERANYWKDYQAWSNAALKALSGAAVTSGEAERFKRANIDATTDPRVAYRNLKEQQYYYSLGMIRLASWLRNKGAPESQIAETIGGDLNEFQKIAAEGPPPPDAYLDGKGVPSKAGDAKPGPGSKNPDPLGLF